MTSLLISITNQAEAEMAISCGADIIDLKDPSQGALGALPIAKVKELVGLINSRKQVSATIGDVPMEANLIHRSVADFSSLNLEYIKVGFFEAHDYTDCLNKLHYFTKEGVKIIAVLFVEIDYPNDLIEKIADAGFVGVMFDTCVKNGKTIFDVYTLDQVMHLKRTAERLGLMFGLAGSLNIKHADNLNLVAPDFAGFRGGVCEAGSRVHGLNADKINDVRKIL